MKKFSSVGDLKKLLAGAIPCLVFAIFFVAVTAGTFVGGIWSIAAIAGAILLFAAVWVADGRVPRPATALAALTVVALIIMAFLNLHSSQPKISWLEWERLGTIFLPLLVFSSRAVQLRAMSSRLFAILVIVAAASAFLLGIELDSGGVLLQILSRHMEPLTRYNRGLSYLVILSFPIIAGLLLSDKSRLPGNRKAVDFLGHQWPLLLFIPALFLCTSLTESRASKLALIVGLAVTALAYFLPVITRRALITLPLLFIAWPFAAQKFFLTYYEWLKHFPDSWRARMEIWDYMSYRIMERPLLGWGLGTSQTLDFRNPHGASYVFTTTAATHPHNALIQLWVELGLPGVALGIAFALIALRKASRLDPKLAPFALGSWAAALCLSLVAYGFWTDSLFAAFALAGFAFALLEQRLTQSNSVIPPAVMAN